MATGSGLRQLPDPTARRAARECDPLPLGIVLLFTVLALMRSSVQSEGADVVPAESRVRVSMLRDSTAGTNTPPESKLIGRFQGVAGDTLLIQANEEPYPRRIPINRVHLLEVSRGVRSHSGRGALIGFGVGAAAGVASAFAVCDDGGCFSDGNDQTGIAAIMFGVGGGLTGLGIGALIGGGIHDEKWERVSLSEVRVGVLPSGRGRTMFVATYTRQF